MAITGLQRTTPCRLPESCSKTPICNRVSLCCRGKKPSSCRTTASEEDFATATIVQRTTARRPNSGFRDNEATASQTYMKDRGLWKIYAQVVQQAKYL